MMRHTRLATLVLLMSFAANVGGVARSQVKVGDSIDPQSAGKVKDLVSPGVYWRVTHGMTMKIVATSKIDWPPPYQEATEKYSGQVMLGPDHRALLGYVAGQPFPLIDANDPYAAAKIMWNNAFRPGASDDYDLRYFDCYDEQPGLNAPVVDVNYTSVGHYAGYNLVGRTEVQPLPTDPDFLKTGRLWLFGVYPVLAPESARGVGLIRYRYADPTHGDDAWTWLAGVRKLRRLNEATLSLNAGSGSGDPDHYSGFNPKTEEYDYRLLGDQNMLACVHAEGSPGHRCQTDGGASDCPEAWEMRHMYIVEASPRREIISQALHGRTVIYMDTEMWGEPYVDTYDRKNQLWQNGVGFLTYRDRPVPKAQVAVYPFARVFAVAAANVDMQGGNGSVCFLPGMETPERECWYINMGAVDRDFFSTEAMVRAAQ